jgi:hypothetical protein
MHVATGAEEDRTMSRRLMLGFVLPLAALVALQLVPYGRDHSNPPDGQLAPWDSRGTEELAQRACYDCHSNQTRWPWYASIAPVSWRVQHNVDEGREKLNLTAFQPGDEKVRDAAGEASEVVARGKMPPKDYLLMHPEAWLSTAERRALADGLRASFAAYGEHGRADGESAHEHGHDD